MWIESVRVTSHSSRIVDSKHSLQQSVTVESFVVNVPIDKLNITTPIRTQCTYSGTLSD